MQAQVENSKREIIALKEEEAAKREHLNTLQAQVENSKRQIIALEEAAAAEREQFEENQAKLQAKIQKKKRKMIKQIALLKEYAEDSDSDSDSMSL